MKYFFPNQNRYLQTNLSDRLGTLWSSFNLDFISKRGTMKLANKLVINTTSVDETNMGLPVAFEYFDDRWYAICGTRIFRNSDENLTSAFVRDTSKYKVGDNTTQFDITNPSGTTFRYTYDGTGTNPRISTSTFPTGALVTIDGANFNSDNNGDFTVTGSGTNYFEVTNASGTAENDKTLGTGYLIVYGGTLATFLPQESDLALFNDRIWSTTTNRLYSKDAGDTYWVERYSIGGLNQKLLYFKKRDKLYFFDSNNSISSINTDDSLNITTGDYYLALPGDGSAQLSTMVETSDYIWIALLRITNPTDASDNVGQIYQWDGISSQITKSYKINASGAMSMCVYNDIPYAIDSEGRVLKYTGYSFEEISRLPIDRKLLTNSNISSGFKWIHKNGMTATKNNTLLFLINNKNDDGTINENLPSGIWELDLATGNFTHKSAPTLKKRDTATTTDYGQNRVSAVGALKISNLSTTSNLGKSDILAGVSYYTDATTEKSAIFIDSPAGAATDYEAQKRGYFVTTWFESSEITETFTRLWTTFKKFLNSTDKMIFKYRLDDVEPIEATITWTSTTTFTTTTNISAYAGYEAEIIQGTGSGACTNISTVTESGGTYTATIDTAVTGVTGTAKARFQKWIKLGEITGQVLSYGEIPIVATDNRIQIKGILEWTGDNEFHKLCVVGTENLNIKP